jgi:heat shock protein HslJ
VSKTELEEELRSTFERAAASVPPAPYLTARAESGVRRQRRTWAASGVAAAAVAAIAVTGIALQGGPGGAPATQPPAAGATSASTSASVPTITMMSGTWQPMRMTGFSGLKRARPERPVLTFAADGTWTGSDGCNSLNGTFTIGPGGQFSSKSNPQRLAGCENVPHTGVLAEAKKVTADAATLRFYTADGREVATYARTQ